MQFELFVFFLRDCAELQASFLLDYCSRPLLEVVAGGSVRSVSSYQFTS